MLLLFYTCITDLGWIVIRCNWVLTMRGSHSDLYTGWTSNLKEVFLWPPILKVLQPGNGVALGNAVIQCHILLEASGSW